MTSRPNWLVAPRPGVAGVPAGAALRMLAVFCLPTATSVLALRRERFELVRLVRRIAARQRRRVELTVVQYGATRERLAAVAEAGDGWDVLHLSGHGGRGRSCWRTRTGLRIRSILPCWSELLAAVAAAAEAGGGVGV